LNLLKRLSIVASFAVLVNVAYASDSFEQIVTPFIARYCADCHDDASREGDLDLTIYKSSTDVARAHPIWKNVLDRITIGDMPPEDAAEHPSDDERAAVTAWIKDARAAEAVRTAGDPGNVIARRLSNAEYDYTIRDLTGVDIRPTQMFPVDPANEAGFDNSGESLTMSPALITKYLEAARGVVEHIVWTPHGMKFAPHRVVSETDRDKFSVNQIIDFYAAQPTDLADYFFAAWQYRHSVADRSAIIANELNSSDDRGAINDTINDVTKPLSPTYFKTVWRLLAEDRNAIGPIKNLQLMWDALPPSGDDDAVRQACAEMRDWVNKTRSLFVPTFLDLDISGANKGSQPLVIWKNKQRMKYRRHADFAFLDADNASSRTDLPFDLPNDDSRQKFEADSERFCSVFPDAFYIKQRGRDYLGESDNSEAEGRLLSAGFHSMTGYFRDDEPLASLILDDAGRTELNALWEQFAVVSNTPVRQYQGLLWFEKAETGFMDKADFDFARSEDAASLSTELIERLASVYVDTAHRRKADEVTIETIKEFFIEIDSQIRSVEQARVIAEPEQLEAVVRFAADAFRGQHNADDDTAIRGFYQRLRGESLSHQEALEDTVVTVLMSPRFMYRVDLLRDGDAERPLDDFELACRLSYFLWSSMPDETLLRCASNQTLHQPDVMREQVARMLRDERSAALAKEFLGNWLDFRRFDEHNAVDRTRFPSFDDALRQAMFEEPLRFLDDAVKRDASVLELLYADHTLVNETLANHYGMDGLDFSDSSWQRVDDVNRLGRGGLLPMAVFLTKNAPGLRTSPVKRGYWVVKRLLGEPIPAPPPNVPDIPDDESKLGDLTLKETLAVHRANVACAACHDRIDSMGLAFEGYGPIGERRSVDLGGRDIDDSALYPDGKTRRGIDELREYIRSEREADFLDNLYRKLLAYALSRTLQLSDESLVASIAQSADASDHRLGAIIEAIVMSKPFLNKRGAEVSVDE